MINFSINFKELTLDNVGKWPKPIKVGLVIFMALVVFGLGYFLIVQPNIDGYNELSQKEISLKSDFEKLQRQASNLPAYREQMNQMEERFGNMLKQLPTQNEMPSLLEDISKTGIASGLKFELFAPAPEIKHDFYIELPIQIVVIGNYQQLAVFLSRIAQMGRIVTLHDFVIEAPEADKQKKIQGEQLSMKITATIYRYRTQ
jgi:type IV pilus assembly protein PilO